MAASAAATGDTFSPAPGDHFPAIPKSYLQSSYAIYRGLESSGIEALETLIYAHPNGVALIALAAGHPLLLSPPPLPSRQTTSTVDNNQVATGQVEPSVPQLSFQTEAGNLLNAEFRKGRGPVLQPGHPLAIVTAAADGASYILRTPAKGALIEANAALEGLSGDSLLRALTGEYIAILKLSPPELQALKTTLQPVISPL